MYQSPNFLQNTSIAIKVSEFSLVIDNNLLKYLDKPPTGTSSPCKCLVVGEVVGSGFKTHWVCA